MLSQEELNDLRVVVATDLAEDYRIAIEENFPRAQLLDWALVRRRMHFGLIAIHELRSAATNELLSARMIIDHPASMRGDPQFLLESFAVTPNGRASENKQNRGKGYGSFLREKSVEISRKQKTQALGLVAERESIKGVTLQSDQRIRSARWMSRMGLLLVEGLEYCMPPRWAELPDAEYVAMDEREGAMKAADLLIYRFDEITTIDGKTLKSIVSRLYSNCYGVVEFEDFYRNRMALIDESREYNLIAS